MSETVAIALWDGVEELDVVGPYEVLTAWAGSANGRSIRVHTVAERADEIRCAHGLGLLPDRTWDNIGELDVLVLPGGNARPQTQDERVLARVRRARRERDADDQRLHRCAHPRRGGPPRGAPGDDALECTGGTRSLRRRGGTAGRPLRRRRDGRHLGGRLGRHRHGPPPGGAARLPRTGAARPALHPVRPGPPA